MPAPSRKLAELFYELRAHTEGLDKDLAQSQRSLGKLSAFVIANPIAAATALAAALVGVGVKAIAMANEVERGMRRVAAVTSGGAPGLRQLRQDIEAMSAATGRSQAELANAAALAAKSAGSTEEVSQRLRAALDVSQATGEDLAQVLEATDQALDVFGLSSAEASKALATLFSAAKGRQSITDLFALLQAAAPAINTLGLDIETASKALVALGERGLSARQAASELNKLAEFGAKGRAEIDQLAQSVRTAADPMRELAEAADTVNNSTENLGAKIRAQFAAELIELGTELARLVNPALRTFNELLASLRGTVTAGFGDRALKDFLANAEKGSTNVRDKFGDLTTEFGRTSDAVQRMGHALKEGSLELEALGGARLGEIVKQLLAFKQAIPDTLGFDHLRRQVDDLLNAAIKAKNTLDQSSTPTTRDPLPSTGLERGKELLAESERDRAAADKLFAEGMAKLEQIRKATADAGREFADFQREGFKNLAEISGNTVALIDAEIDDVAARITKAGLAAGRSADEIAQAIAANTVHLVAAKRAAEAFNGAVEKITIPDGLKRQLDTFPLLTREIETLRKQLIAAGKTPAAVAEAIQDAFGDRVVAAFKAAGFSTEEAKEKAKEFADGLGDVEQKATDVADAIQTIGNAVISILGAFGALDDRLEHTARGLVNVGTGIADIASGNLLSGGASLLGGIADIMKGLGDDPEVERRHQESLRALEGIRKNTGDLLGRQTSGSQIVRAQSAAEFVLREGRLNPRDPLTFINLDELLERAGFSFREVEEVAREFGVTLDGTIGQWVALKGVLDQIDLRALRDTFEGQVEAARLIRQITGNQNPLAELIDTANALARFSPEFAKVFEGLNLEVAQDRAIALQRVMETLNRALAGEIDFASMGISLDEFLSGLGGIADLIRELVPALEALNPLFGDVGDKSTRFSKQLKGLNLAFDAIDLRAQFGGLSLEEQLQEKIQAFAQAFGESASQIDFSSLESFKDTAQNVIDGFFADGELTEAEKAQITVLQELLSAFAAAEAGALSLADTLRQAFGDIDLDAIIFGTSPSDVINKKFTELGLDAFDLGTQAGRDAAREALRTLAQGDPSLKPLIADLIRSLDALPEIPGATKEAIESAIGAGGGERSSIASAAQGLTERTGNRMADYLATGLVLDRRKVALLEEIAASVNLSRGVLVQPPALSQFAAAVGGVGTVEGGLTINAVFHITVDGSTPDAKATGDRIGDAAFQRFVRRVSQELARQTIDQRRISGNTTIS